MTLAYAWGVNDTLLWDASFMGFDQQGNLVSARATHLIWMCLPSQIFYDSDALKVPLAEVTLKSKTTIWHNWQSGKTGKCPDSLTSVVDKPELVTSGHIISHNEDGEVTGETPVSLQPSQLSYTLSQPAIHYESLHRIFLKLNSYFGQHWQKEMSF